MGDPQWLQLTGVRGDDLPSVRVHSRRRAVQPDRASTISTRDSASDHESNAGDASSPPISDFAGGSPFSRTIRPLRARRLQMPLIWFRGVLEAELNDRSIHMRSMTRRRRTGVVIEAISSLVGRCLVGSPPQAVAHPRATLDGQLLFTLYDPTLDDEVPFTVNPDGSHPEQIYPYATVCPHWSPDGTQVASCGVPFGDQNGTTILTVGTGQVRDLPFLLGLTYSPCYVLSPHSKRLACEAGDDNHPSRNGIYTVRVSDWSDIRRVTTNVGGGDVPGSYSPNGNRPTYASYTGDDEGPSLHRTVRRTCKRRQAHPPHPSRLRHLIARRLVTLRQRDHLLQTPHRRRPPNPVDGPRQRAWTPADQRTHNPLMWRRSRQPQLPRLLQPGLVAIGTANRLRRQHGQRQRPLHPRPLHQPPPPPR